MLNKVLLNLEVFLFYPKHLLEHTTAKQADTNVNEAKRKKRKKKSKTNDSS